MEYLGQQEEQSEYFAETAAGDGDWKTSLMESSEAESCYSGLLGEQATKNIVEMENPSFLVAVLRHISPSYQPSAHGSGRCKSQSTMSTILRNLFTCRTVDTKDSVIELRHNSNNKKLPTDAYLEICKVDKLGGFGKTLEDPCNQKRSGNIFDELRFRRQNTDKGEFTDPKPVPPAYRPRPVIFPTCSLCGKPFKPENLHSHMKKSCRGMKMLTKNAAKASGTRENPSSWRSATSSDRETDQTSLLCH